MPSVDAMALTHQRIQEVIARLVPVIRQLAGESGFDDVEPRPHPPASEADIAVLERFLERPLPDSHRAFLQLYDGYDWLAYPGHMLSIRDMMPGSERYSRIVEWKKTVTEYGGGEVLDGIVFASLEEPREWVFLDPNQPTTSTELTVVAFYHDDSHEFRDVVEFLESRITYCLEILSPGDPDANDGDE
jgi:hypothetical protein